MWGLPKNETHMTSKAIVTIKWWCQVSQIKVYLKCHRAWVSPEVGDICLQGLGLCVTFANITGVADWLWKSLTSPGIYASEYILAKKLQEQYLHLNFPCNKRYLRNVPDWHNRNLNSDLIKACQYLHLGDISSIACFFQWLEAKTEQNQAYNKNVYFLKEGWLATKMVVGSLPVKAFW